MLQFNNVILTDIFVANEGQLWTVGQNAHGSLGDGTVVSKSSPVQTIAGGTNWQSLSSGAYVHGGIKSDGTLWVWGSNYYGGLGRNNTIKYSSPVQTVSGGTNWKQATVGYTSAAIKTDGTLWTWGYNPHGGLGTNDRTDRSSPVQTVSGGTTWKKVAATDIAMAAIKTDGTLWTWGYNVNGSLGDNTTVNKSSPVQIYGGGTNWKDIYISAQTMIGLKTDGTLWTWGNNTNGELGNNDVNLNSVSSPIQTVAAGTNWKSLATGVGNSGTGSVAAIKTDGTLYVWGDNTYGQLGVGDTTHRSSPVQTIAGGTNWLQVSTSSFAMAGVKTDGTLWSWGYNGVGVLGLNDRTNRSSPVQTVDGRNNWLQVSVSSAGIAALAYIPDVGRLWVWGNQRNQFGTTINKLADGTSTDKSSPVQTIAGGTNWKQLAVTNMYSAAIKSDGTLWTWGRNNYGQLGTDDTSNRSSPTQTVAAGTNWKQVSVGGAGSTGAVKTDGTLWMWGRNSFGQLGTNNRTNYSSPVQTISAGSNWSYIGTNSNCVAIKTDGTLWTWGYNGEGNLGDNTTVHKSSPVQTVAGGTNWLAAAPGDGETASPTGAVKTDGTLWMWGNGIYGQLGDGTIVSKSSPVQTIAAGTTWKSIEIGQYQRTVAAIKTDGSLWMWGFNSSYELGDGTTDNRSSPVLTFGGGSTWRKVVVFETVAGIKTDGSLWLWGSNGFGNLGDGTSGAPKSSPVQTLVGGNNWIDVSTAGYAVMAIAW